MCPVSNVRTGTIPSVAEHPIREFIDQGIKVTVNSDDPSMFGTDMNNEYIQLHEQLGFSVEELFRISLNAVDTAFIKNIEKKMLKEKFKKEYQSLTSKTIQ